LQDFKHVGTAYTSGLLRLLPMAAAQSSSLYGFAANNKPGPLKYLQTGRKVAKNPHFVPFFWRFWRLLGKSLDFRPSER
jgi:hypothetical protein